MVFDNATVPIDASLQVGFNATGQPVANVQTQNGEQPPIQEIIQRVNVRREILLRELALETAWLVAIQQAKGRRLIVPDKRLVVPR